jgi:MFS transporter, DHA3 family, macrolide efflux protein
MTSPPQAVENDISRRNFRHSNPPLGTGGDLHPPPGPPYPPATPSDPSPLTLSYFHFLSTNRNFCWFISSYSITYFGEWLTYIASIDFIESVREKQDQSTSRTAISILILVRLLPNVILSAIGGTLADSLDRRYVMIGLDICGTLCAGLFLYAYHLESIRLLYLATVVQQSVAGLYAPSHSAIVPQLVDSDAQLKIATTLEGLIWSAMQAFGAAASGWIVDALGIKMCFIIDAASYAISAILLCLLRGSFCVEQARLDLDTFPGKTTNGTAASPIQRFFEMVTDATRYLWSSHFGALIFLKGTAALGFGACDVLNVAFSEVESNTATRISPNQKMGILFSFVGVGCWLGPMIADPWVHVEQPKTLQVSCIMGFILSMIGYFGWATIPYFWSVCVFAVIRAAGSSNIWIHSTLLLQKFSAPQMMGRVLAADYAIALVCEAAAAYACGVFMDHHTTWTPYNVSLVLAVVTTCTTTFWISYHVAGLGACHLQDTNSTIDPDQEVAASEMSALLSTAGTKMAKQ